jgi:6-phosphogluconolactonase
MSEPEVHILPDGPAIARRAAERLVVAAASAVQQKGSFSIALAGGSTPKLLYSLLVAEPFSSQLPWEKFNAFFGDERHVPPDHHDSNYRMASETLFSKSPLQPSQVHRIKAEDPDADRAALDYQQVLRSEFRLGDQQRPRFDLVLLGMGEEGHTLSLFPGTRALHDNGRLVMANWVGKLYTERITLTAPVVNEAALVIFMITGAAKAPALKAVLEGPHEPEQLPAQLIRPVNGDLLWLVDKDAGGMLAKGIRD